MMKLRLPNCAGFVRKTLLIVLVLVAVGLAFYGGELLDLLRFYQGIDAQVATAQERGEKAHALAQSCVTCHGFDGNNLSSLYPSLAGLPADYLVAQLEAFAAGTRDEPMMGPLAAIRSAKRRARSKAAWPPRLHPLNRGKGRAGLGGRSEGGALPASGHGLSCHLVHGSAARPRILRGPAFGLGGEASCRPP